MMNDCTSCFHGFDHQTTVHCYSERLLYPMIKLRIYKGSPHCPADRISATSHQPARQAWRPSLVRQSIKHMPRYCYTPSQGHKQARGVHGVAHRTPAAIRRIHRRNSGSSRRVLKDPWGNTVEMADTGAAEFVSKPTKVTYYCETTRIQTVWVERKGKWVELKSPEGN